MMVCCVFSSGGDSKEYTQHTIINIKTKIIQNTIMFAAIYGIFFVRVSRTSSQKPYSKRAISI